MLIPARSVLTAFKEVEQQFRDFSDRVPFVPEHDQVWSPALASCIMEACSQLDSFWKASLPAGSGVNTTISDHFLNHSVLVGSRWVVVWGNEGRELAPFADWNSSSPVTKAAYKPLAWWQAYNAIKHDRWANIRQATILNAANAVAGLYLAIARSSDCADSLVESGWFRSSWSTPHAVQRMISGPETPELGITIESALFSYAAASSAPDFERYLTAYHECSHRFGRWLERKYKRGIVL
jgi:hypothetical protein